jgi:transcriptional regulator with XRE-family HTH domain
MEKLDLRRLGDFIHTVRRHRQMTQKALAERAGLAPSLVSQIEAGKRPQVSFEVITRLLKALGVTSLDLTVLENTAREHETSAHEPAPAAVA